MIYGAAGLVVAALVAMASGKVDPLLALILAAILGIATPDQLAGRRRRSRDRRVLGEHPRRQREQRGDAPAEREHGEGHDARDVRA
jgi:hypothetical protein